MHCCHPFFGYHHAYVLLYLVIEATKVQRRSFIKGWLVRLVGSTDATWRVLGMSAGVLHKSRFDSLVVKELLQPLPGLTNRKLFGYTSLDLFSAARYHLRNVARGGRTLIRCCRAFHIFICSPFPRELTHINDVPLDITRSISYPTQKPIRTERSHLYIILLILYFPRKFAQTDFRICT